MSQFFSSTAPGTRIDATSLHDPISREKIHAPEPDNIGSTFTTTRWTQIHKIVTGNERESFGELSRWCEIYWKPLYIFAIKWGRTPETAKDSTQSFFLALLEKHYLDQADRSRGRLRTYLIALFKHHLSHEHRDSQRLMRGGGAIHLSMDTATGVDNILRDTGDTPEEAFNRQWVTLLLEGALTEVEHEWRARGKSAVFDLLRPHLLGEQETDLISIAKNLDKPEGTIRSYLYRLRLAYSAAVSAAIAATLVDESPEAVKAEIQELIHYFGSHPPTP
jgi:DNA-directed RNA polymerase specialized sigma24 family protein